MENMQNWKIGKAKKQKCTKMHINVNDAKLQKWNSKFKSVTNARNEKMQKLPNNSYNSKT